MRLSLIPLVVMKTLTESSHWLFKLFQLFIVSIAIYKVFQLASLLPADFWLLHNNEVLEH